MKIKSTMKATIVITDTFDIDKENLFTKDEVKDGLINILNENITENGIVDILEFSLSTAEVN